MINWKEIYEKTLRDICEEDENFFDNIVELERPEFQGDLIKNPNAKENSLFALMLDDNATDEDYKKFVEYIYGYIGEDINDYLTNEENPKAESEGNDMEAEKIRNLLKRYGAEDKEIENFMTDLYETKDEMKDEEEDFNYLDGDTMAKLKATKEGQDLIINAPKMAKDELKKAIKDYLSK
jgi:hypothetical protein